MDSEHRVLLGFIVVVVCISAVLIVAMYCDHTQQMAALGYHEQPTGNGYIWVKDKP